MVFLQRETFLYIFLHSSIGNSLLPNIVTHPTTFNLFYIGGEEYAIRFDKNLNSKSKFFNTKIFFIDAEEFDKYKLGEGVIVCDSKDMRAKRQVVEGVISQIKLFIAGSGGRTLTCVLVYVYAYAIGYSYYRRGELEA